MRSDLKNLGGFKVEFEAALWYETKNGGEKSRETVSLTVLTVSLCAYRTVNAHVRRPVCTYTDTFFIRKHLCKNIQTQNVSFSLID